jgi:hypothetical protein
VRQRFLRILWPAFLMSGALEGMVFAVVDPHQMRWFGGPLIGWEPLTIYSLTFLIFWSVIATSGALTTLLTLTAEEVNALGEDPTEAAAPHSGS